MTWPTPKDNASPNAACNKFLGLLCSDPARDKPPNKIMVEAPGSRSFKAVLLGWDAYSLILQLEDGRVMLMFKEPGTKIYPYEGFLRFP
jgi:hypothetical protein